MCIVEGRVLLKLMLAILLISLAIAIDTVQLRGVRRFGLWLPPVSIEEPHLLPKILELLRSDLAQRGASRSIDNGEWLNLIVGAEHPVDVIGRVVLNAHEFSLNTIGGFDGGRFEAAVVVKAVLHE